MLSVLALGMLIAVGAAIGGAPYAEQNYEQPHNGGYHGDNNNFDGFNNHYDWLNTGGYYPYGFYQTYPYSYYPTYNYPTYNYPTYTYPTYTYPAPVVYNPYAYDPVYDPWYATNVYGWGGATYYYSSSWSWSSHHGGFFN
jgi:hypothetical protein